MNAAPSIQSVRKACFHCGESLESPDAIVAEIGGDVRGFCCHGCFGAAELIYTLGLSNYYDRREPPDPSVQSLAPRLRDDFARFDDPALQRSFVTRESNGDLSATLSVGGMRCAACCWLLEERLARVAGIREARFGLTNQRARVRWNPDEIEFSHLLLRIAEIGYRAVPFEPDVAEALLRSERRASMRRIGVSGLGAMQVMMFSVALYAGSGGDLEVAYRDLLRIASLLVTTPVLIYAGYPFLSGAWRDLQVLRVGPDVPIALALLGAYSASAWATATGKGEVYFDSVCMFIFFISLGRALERNFRARAELRIRGLQQRVPQVAHRVQNATQRDVPAAFLELGDVLVIHPGENVPADGLVIEGQGTVSESLLTGEASPVAKQAGSSLLAGSENLDAMLWMRVERTGAASTLQQISSLLDRAQLDKPPIAELADRLARIFLTSVVAAAVAVGIFWWGADVSQVIPIVVSVLIATCPCALSLATPTALAAATHGLAARGFLITRGHALEALARVDRVVFDKTGTLTTALPALRTLRTVRPEIDASQALQLAICLEGTSRHPLARALRAAEKSGAAACVVASTESGVEPGAGVVGKVNGRMLRLGRPEWSAALSGVALKAKAGRPGSCESTALLCDEQGPIAWFEFEMALRPGACEVTEWLGEWGCVCSLLSGDPSEQAVEVIAHRLGIRDARSGISPEAKVAALDDWVARGETIAAIGDGINDTPLLGRAHVSVAMGSGSDLAHLHADAVLLDDRLSSIPLALHWARRTKRVMQQNFAWALGYNLCVLPLAAMGLLPPYGAAIGMSISSLLVVGNSMRLRHPSRGRIWEGRI